MHDDCFLKELDSQASLRVSLRHIRQELLQLHGRLNRVDLKCKQGFILLIREEAIFNYVQDLFHLPIRNIFYKLAQKVQFELQHKWASLERLCDRLAHSWDVLFQIILISIP